jgi:hypothetical protein
MATHEHLDEWVDRRMAASEPPAEWPDPGIGLKRLDRRLAARRPRVLLWAAATAVVVVAAFALPASRAAAQRLWNQVVLDRLQVLVTDYDKYGEAAGLFSPEFHEADFHAVASFEEAVRETGFSPRLPGPDLVSTAPKYSTITIAPPRLRLHTPAIRSALAKAGGSATDVPSRGTT